MTSTRNLAQSAPSSRVDADEIPGDGRAAASRPRPARRATPKDAAVRVHAWFDATVLASVADPEPVLERVLSSAYTAVVLTRDGAVDPGRLPDTMVRVLLVPDAEEWRRVSEAEVIPRGDARRVWVVASADEAVLTSAAREGLATCLRASASDEAGLRAAVAAARAHRYLCIRFPDPTNIPLELAIASLQFTPTIVIKELDHDADVQDAVVSLAVMEVGSDGVLFSPTSPAVVDTFARAVREAGHVPLTLAPATVTRNVPAGVGHRGCIDLATLFTPEEGMLIGSTSQGGLLCCPEVFYLPYMDLRPFRVNAGGVHSYVYATGDRTNYLTELRAGVPAMVVGLDGHTREVPVGRIKTEVRPLRLIEAQFAGGETVNVLMQDDWHVRIFSADGGPRNITELAPGDKVLGHLSIPGRHVGIAVDETIEEC